MIRNPVSILWGLVLLLSALSSPAATLDPLLKHLLDMDAGKSTWDFHLDDLIVIDQTHKSGETRVGVILFLEDDLPDLSPITDLVVGSTIGGIATARLPLHELALLADIRGIRHIAAARIFRPSLDLAILSSNVDQVWNGAPAYNGSGVLIGMIDTGIDWRHADFRNTDGTTRIEAIWDVFNTTGTPPAGFYVGTEYTRIRIDAALLGGNPVGEADLLGHGSHVAGIATGNGRASGGLYRGVAYAADLLIAKPYQNGFPETETIDAMNYLVQTAQNLGRPIVINMSLGGQFGGHDGTSAQEIVIDALSGPSVVFCIAAGNSGNSFITQRGDSHDLTFDLQVPAYTPNPGIDNDYIQMVIWYDGTSNPDITLTNGNTTLGPVTSGQEAYRSTLWGALGIDNATTGPDPLNGDKMCLILLSDNLGSEPAATTWTITVRGGIGLAHAWVAGSTMLAFFPGSDQAYSLDMPSTAFKAISVAAYKTRQSWTSLDGLFGYGGEWASVPIGGRAPFSAIGPTRDQREKPDISAPGMGIISVYSADQSPPSSNQVVIPGSKYQVAAGTSMSTPVVSGIVALMLEKNRNLDAVDVLAILRDTAAHDAQTGGGWTPQYGAGKVDAFAAVAAVSGGNTDFGGDVDGSGELDTDDIALLAAHILDPTSVTLTTAQREAADVFPVAAGDGNLDISDVARLIAYVNGAGLIGAPSTATETADLLRGTPYRRNGTWWLPLILSGADLTGCQLVVDVPDAAWIPADIRHDGGITSVVAAVSTGDRLRIMVYDTSRRFSADGLTVELPFQGNLADKALPSIVDVRAADPFGYPRQMETRAPGRSLPTILFLETTPNPSAGSITISYQLSRAVSASLEIYDLRGRLVRRFEETQPGLALQTLAWDRSDTDGRRVSDGIYLLKLGAGGQEVFGKVLLMR